MWFLCPMEQYCAHSTVFSFLVSPLCTIRGELSAEYSCADIVIKSTTARVSSPHSPLICQPCSDGRLCKYMQNRWIRPLHTLPPDFRLFQTLQTPPPPKTVWATLDIHTNTYVHAHSYSFTSPCFPFQRWSKTNYTDWGTMPFKKFTAKHCSAFNRTSKENHKTNLARRIVTRKRGVM